MSVESFVYYTVFVNDFQISDDSKWMGVNRIANWVPYLLLNNELELYFLMNSE